MNKVALLILFNHNYEKNIGKLEEIYSHRFEDIFFIMPFYRGKRKNVIKVFENSYYFQGYISKALEQIKNDKYEHYIFIGDDLFLNPSINNTNYKEFFRVDSQTAFVPKIFLLNDMNETRPFRPFAPYWSWNFNALNFRTTQEGIEAEKQLPEYEEALAILKKHGYEFTPDMSIRMFFYNNLFKSPWGREERIKKWYYLKLFLKKIPQIIKLKKIRYPLIGSYSDCIVIPHNYVDPMIHYCGVFSALNLFVEIALPTALAFATPKIVTELELAYKGETYWLDSGSEKCKAKYHKSLKYLETNFPENTLYIHPVKVSQWN